MRQCLCRATGLTQNEDGFQGERKALVYSILAELTLCLQFSNLLGTVYSRGNLLFAPDGTCLFSPVGNRVTVFDLVK